MEPPELERWDAEGNVYLVSEPFGATPARVRELVGDADGVLEVSPEGEVAIWNPDGSRAEMSGNGTRIAAAWLAARTGAAAVTLVVGGRSVTVRALGEGRFEQDLGEVRVGRAEEVAGIRLVPVDVGNPHAVVEGEPHELSRIGPLLESHPRFPGRTNVQVARVHRPGHIRARVWERGVGETASSGSSAVAVAAALAGEGETTVAFPGGELVVRIEGGRATLTGRAERVG
jgi:diaminopimelate epimerase